MTLRIWKVHGRCTRMRTHESGAASSASSSQKMRALPSPLPECVNRLIVKDTRLRKRAAAVDLERHPWRGVSWFPCSPHAVLPRRGGMRVNACRMHTECIPNATRKKICMPAVIPGRACRGASPLQPPMQPKMRRRRSECVRMRKNVMEYRMQECRRMHMRH